MQAFPHHYHATAQAVNSSSRINVSSTPFPDITTDAPAEFGGPGDQWTPEGLLMAAVADCFALTFRAVANASKFEWLALRCEAQGTLDRVEKVTRFTDIKLNVSLTVPAGTAATQAERLLHKSEENCLITNSMTTIVTLDIEIIEQ